MTRITLDDPPQRQTHVYLQLHSVTRLEMRTNKAPLCSGLSVFQAECFFFYGHAAAVKISVGVEGKEVGLFSLVFGVLTKTEAQI